MEEDDVVKAPVTRLRRRLSVENEVGSPAAPSTPTKKRLATKPQLGNIDELAPVDSPRGKRRTSSVRGTLDTPEEKPATPARRSTRIKSNTSITSEVVQSFDSPRAKRAARRTSFVGSDTEAPLTPVRKTRRTRKDSASSLENQETVTKLTTQLAKEIISEEPEAPKTSANNSLSSDSISPNTRKSQRIAAKRASRNSLNKSDMESNTSLNKSKVDEIKKDTSPKVTLSPKLSKIVNDNNEELNNSDAIEKKLNSSKLKDDSINESQPQTKKSRESLTNIPEPTSEIDINEDIKQNTSSNRSLNRKKLSNDVGAGDAFVFEAKIDIANQSLPTSDKENIDIVLNTSKRKKRESERSISSTKSEVSDNASNKRKSSDKPDGIDTVDASAKTNDSVNFLQETIDQNIKCKVYIEDSDSNTGSIGKSNNVQSNDTDDQCVPVVEKLNESDEPTLKKAGHIIEDQNSNIELDKEKSSLFASKTLNCSIEPMDIDETMPENVSNINSSTANKLAVNESHKSFKNISSSVVEKVDSSANNSTIAGNKSNNLDKSVLSRSERHEKTTNENKSTLILSQLKDDSTSDANATKSPKKKDDSLTNGNESKTKRNSFSITEDSSKTPLKNKHLQKSGMQTSTPVIATNNEKKTEKNNSKIATPKDSSTISTSRNKDMESESNESTDDSSNEGMSQKVSLLNDEAEDAGDDYESGDSQDESQRRYEEENEIFEEGETLTSDGDISNDSDYEKDSFIVSSDEGDQDLLSGSGDDLSDGDNELKMTAESKQKYNARKVKEQKKASREMYEARHGKKKSLRESSDDEETSKPVKKNKRQRIDSSLLESGDDSIIKPKKNNRLRLDSTNDASAVKSDVDESIIKTKSKKNKFLDDTITNEKEITLIGNESILEKKDPLKTAVKAEPKTPQKDFDISTINISTVMAVEEVQVNENASILKANETSDPLQATMAHDDEDSDSSSGNEVIMQNYDSMLSNLTKETKQSRKDLDTSLNLNKKTKQKSNPIKDKLNLTQTKVNKSSNSTETHDKNASTKNANKSNIDFSDDESSSDSIDLKLLFPDDTSESSDGKKKSVTESCYPGDEDFIPLKRTEGKTNLRESIGSQKLDNSTAKATSSNKKKNKNVSDSSNNELSFVAGKKDKNLSFAELTDETPGNISLSKTPGSSKKKKKMSEFSEVQSEVTEDTEANLIGSLSSKKKRNKRNSESSAIEENLIIFEDRTPASDTKKKQFKSISLPDEVPLEAIVNVSVTGSNKKKKKSSESSVVDSNEMLVEAAVNVSVTHSNKKKKNSSESSVADSNETDYPSVLVPVNTKKNKKLSKSLTGDEVDGTSAAKGVAASSSKKNRKLSEPSDVNQKFSLIVAPGNMKKIKKHSVSLPADELNAPNATEEVPISSTKKKNRKSSEPSEASKETATTEVLAEDTLIEVSKASKKRKRNSSVREEMVLDSLLDNPHDLLLTAGSQKKKKRKISDNASDGHQETETISKTESSEVKDSQQTKSKERKKRKNRSDDGKSENAKAIKDTFLENITIPRLPTNILDQLNEKPTYKAAGKPAKIVSTSAFEVVETRPRKNKPSQYLEESIYLNSDSPEKKKRKKNVEKPKVLPFVPTASTSSNGFTTNFRVNVNPRETTFVAQASDLPNFKKDYLHNKKMKKLGTFEMYKKQRSVKLCKF